MKTFSVNAAATLLERDRATIVRCLRGVAPDAKERGHPRWRLRTILDALERHSTPPPPRQQGKQAELTAAYAQLDLAVERLRVLPTLDERRAAALTLVPLLDQADIVARRVAAECGEPAMLTELRLGKLYTMTVRGFEQPCGWSREEAWEHLVAGSDADAA